MKETETLSYSLLCQLYDEVKKIEEYSMSDCNSCCSDDRTPFIIKSALLARTSTIKYLIEDKLFIIWKEINKNE